MINFEGISDRTDAKASALGWYNEYVLCFSVIGLASYNEKISNREENALNRIAKNIAEPRK